MSKLRRHLRPDITGAYGVRSHGAAENIQRTRQKLRKIVGNRRSKNIQQPRLAAVAQAAEAAAVAVAEIKFFYIKRRIHIIFDFNGQRWYMRCLTD